MSRKIWAIVLAVWLLAWGLLALKIINHFEGENLVMAVLAIAAAVLIAFDK